MILMCFLSYLRNLHLLQDAGMHLHLKILIQANPFDPRFRLRVCMTRRSQKRDQEAVAAQQSGLDSKHGRNIFLRIAQPISKYNLEHKDCRYLFRCWKVTFEV